MMSVEISVCLNAAEGSPRPLLYPLRLTRSGGEPGWCLLVSGAVGGDVRVPRLAGADDRVQLAQEGGGEHGLRLCRYELVVLPGVRGERSTG
jgi:hypothetical protein